MEYVLDEEDESTDEYAHFYFIGKFEGKDVIYDTAIYTLDFTMKVNYMKSLNIVQHSIFRNIKKITYEEDENGNLAALDPLEEEIGLYMAEVIMTLEEEESVKVKEHVDLDVNTDFGISLDVGLHVEKITPKVIEKFIKGFQRG